MTNHYTDVCEATIESLRQTVERQAAQIEQMREAMLCTDPEMTHHNFIAALEATPDQALEQFAGRVREQCAEVCEEHQGSAETCADAIRAIKELP